MIPDRVRRIIDLHHKNHIEYSWEQEDKNERIFEYRRTLRPNTYSYTVESIYRVRDPANKTKEYYFYIMKARVLNDDNEPEYSNSLTYGFGVEPVHELRYNEQAKRKEPVKVRVDPVYYFEWNKKEVAKLLEKSEIPCINLYIGMAYGKGEGNLGIAKDILSVKYKDDFLNGDMDTLMLLNKAGIMSPEHSTISMVEKARSKFEEEYLKKIAAVSTPTPTTTAATQGENR